MSGVRLSICLSYVHMSHCNLRTAYSNFMKLVFMMVKRSVYFLVKIGFKHFELLDFITKKGCVFFTCRAVSQKNDF